MKRIILLLITAMLVLASPAVAKENQKELDVAEIANSINLEFWNRFNDPLLTDYVRKAVNSNKDLQIAVLDIQKQRSTVRETFANELPTLNMLGNFLRFRPDFTGQPNVTYENSFSGFFLPTYEIDILQKNRRKTKAQEEILEGNLQDARATYLMIAAETAAAYINILSADKSIIFQQEAVNLDKQALSLRQAKYSAGLDSYGKVLHAEKELRDSEILLTELIRARELFLNQLAVLIDRSPEDCNMLPRGDFDNLCLTIAPDIAIPSNKIMQRPDILKAEALINKTKLDVEFERRDFLPNLNLYGILGFNSFELTKTTNIRNYITWVGAGFFHRVFQGGARFARLRRKKYDYEQVLTDYQHTILTSLQEVNDNLVNLKSDLKISSDIDGILQAEEQDLYLENLKFEQGLISFFDTLPDKKDVIMLSQDSIQKNTNYYLDYINLYKSLAGNL